MTIREKILEIVREIDAGPVLKLKIRVALRAKPDLLAELIHNKAIEEGVLPFGHLNDVPEEYGDISWAAFSEWILKILPQIVNMLGLFV